MKEQTLSDTLARGRVVGDKPRECAALTRACWLCMRGIDRAGLFGEAMARPNAKGISPSLG